MLYKGYIVSYNIEAWAKWLLLCMWHISRQCVSFLNVWISNKMLLKWVPGGLNMSSLVQVMAWHQTDTKPLYKAMMFFGSLMHKCITLPLWIIRDQFVYAPSQWETTLQCNILFHWLGPFTNKKVPDYASKLSLPFAPAPQNDVK